jgi:hypothetical protein
VAPPGYAPGSLSEALLFAEGAMLTAFPAFMFNSYFSVPPAHRTARMLQADLVVSLGVAGGISLAGAVSFLLAQIRRRKQGRLVRQTLRPSLPAALGVAHPIAFLMIVRLCQRLLSLGDVTLLACFVGLALPVGLSRIGWRSPVPPGSLHIGP